MNDNIKTALFILFYFALGILLGYIIGEEPNGERKRIIKRESAVKVKIPRERVIFGDIPDYGDGKSNYIE